MSANLVLKLNEKLYLRDPQETELGRKIIINSIKMIDQIGFEQFTFKKLATGVESTEASVYRYFENKHKLLIYLISWYWVWLDYRITFETHNIKDSVEKLKIIIRIIAESQQDDPLTELDESILHKIVVSEAAKAYLTKEVDVNNKDGLFREYKKLCKRIAEIILEINPQHEYPNALVSMLIETAHQQLFFAQHLPSLTNIKHNEDEFFQLIRFLEHILFSSVYSYNYEKNGKARSKAK